MSGEFDPYREWLRIKSPRRPVTYYELLGLGPFESDTKKIDESLESRYALVRRYQVGERGPLAIQILQELSRAHGCLRDAGRRGAYDAQLRAAEAPAKQPQAEPPRITTPPRVSGAAPASRPARPVADQTPAPRMRPPATGAPAGPAMNEDELIRGVDANAAALDAGGRTPAGSSAPGTMVESPVAPVTPTWAGGMISAPAANYYQQDAPVYVVQLPDGRRIGPVSKSQLDQGVANGRIAPRALIWRAGWYAAVPAYEAYPELATELSTRFVAKPRRAERPAALLWIGGGLAVIGALVVTILLLTRGADDEPSTDSLTTTSAGTAEGAAPSPPSFDNEPSLTDGSHPAPLPGGPPPAMNSGSLGARPFDPQPNPNPTFPNPGAASPFAPPGDSTAGIGPQVPQPTPTGPTPTGPMPTGPTPTGPTPPIAATGDAGEGSPTGENPFAAPLDTELPEWAAPASAPLRITRIVPDRGTLESVIELEGQGFQGTRQVICVQSQHYVSRAVFEVLSDTRLRVILSKQKLATFFPVAFEVHTPAGVAVTVPPDADSEERVGARFAIFTPGPSRSLSSAQLCLVLEGAKPSRLSGARVYVMPGATISECGSCGLVFPPTAKVNRSGSSNAYMPVPALFPSLVPSLFKPNN